MLGALWAAWSREAELQGQHRRLVEERDDLQQVAAIHARYAPHRDRLRLEEAQAGRSWRQTHQRVDHQEAAREAETRDLLARVWGAWREDLTDARRAAEIVRDGAGRLGQRRRQVRDARADLTAFAERWHPVVSDLPADPAELAVEVRWLHGRRVEAAIDAFVGHQVAAAHPDTDQVRQAERDAHAAYDRAERARSQLDHAMYAELRPYGRAAHVRDAGDSLTALTAELAGVERDLRTAAARVRTVTNDPSIRTLPANRLDDEHDRWAADRLARQQATARKAREHWHRQRRRVEPTPPSRSTPDRGWGIGR